MLDPATVALAEALAAAGTDAALAALARAAADADDTARLRAAVGALRAAAQEGQGPVPVLEPDRLARVCLLVWRDEALEALYAAEARAREPESDRLEAAAATAVRGVWEERTGLDAALGAASTDWRVERMAAVDRAVLRLAAWELRHRPDLSAAVIISEAVRLAKAYSTERSGSFVNGLLSRLAEERAGRS